MRLPMSLALAACLALVLIPWCIARAPRWGLMDAPGGRKHHARPTPLAGVAPVCAALVAIILGAGASPLVLALVLGAAFVTLMGVWDDRAPRSPLLRLCGQVACALPLALLLPWHVVSLPLVGVIDLGSLAPLVWLAWMVVVMNALNFLDGLDGLAAGLIASSGLGLGILAGITGSPLGALVLGSTGVVAAIFALWNLPPAAAFLGDGGVLGLGFLLAGGALIGATKGAASLSLAIPLLALALPLADASSVITWRLTRRQHPWVADRAHIHHRLLDRGWSERRVLLSLWAFASLLVVESLLLAMCLTHRTLIPFVLAGAGAVCAASALLFLPKSARPKTGAHRLDA